MITITGSITESRLYLHTGITLAGALCLYDAGNPASYPGTGVTWFNLITSGTTVGNAIKQGSQVSQGWPRWDSRGWFNFLGGTSVGDNYSRFDFSFPQLNNVSMFVWYRNRVEPLISGEDPFNIQQHVMRSANSTDTDSSYQIIITAGNGIGMCIANSYFPGVNSSSVNTMNGEWHQIVGTRQSSNDEQVLYFDGVRIGSLIASGQIPKAGTMRIGSRNDTYSNHFYGSIAMVGMYQRVLTAAEVYNNYLTMVKRLNRPDYNIGLFPQGDPTRYYER